MDKFKFLYRNNNLHNFVGIVSLILFIVLLLSNHKLYEFSNDEFHAWNIAGTFTFADITRLMRVEGHTILWYLILKPFTYFETIFFPWIIKFLNTIFTISALIVFWRKAPVNLFIKILVTYSLPFLYIYAVYGRCYGIGILFLFLIASLYKNRLEKPVLFAFLIFFAANTSLMAAIGAFSFGAIFLFDIMKSKTIKKAIPIAVIVTTVLSLYLQWHNPIIPYYSKGYIFIDRIRWLLFDSYTYPIVQKISYIIVPLSVISAILYFRNNLRTLFFFLSSWGGLIFVFSLTYGGNEYHHWFFFVYLIISYWLAKTSISQKLISEKIFCICLMFLCIIFNFLLKFEIIWCQPLTEWQKLSRAIEEIVPNKDAVIYSQLYCINGYLPFFKHYKLLDTKRNDLRSFKNYYEIYQKKEKYISISFLKKISDTESYLIVNKADLNDRNIKLYTNGISGIELPFGLTLYKIK